MNEEKSDDLEDDFEDMMDRLREVGCDDDADDQEKLIYLWGLYLDSQASLSDALDSIEDLRKQQADEIKEVENYVEHIRNLSDEREALTLEFEAENEELKAEINKLKQGLSGSTSNEVSEMLLQQGLIDIAHSTPTEQIAFLLVERARLLDELEMDQSSHTPKGRMTDEERSELENEICEQREIMKKVKSQLELQHEEDMSELMDEKDKLEEQLHHLQIGESEKIEQLEMKLRDARKQLAQNKNDHNANATSSSERIKELESENNKLEQKLSLITSEHRKSLDMLKVDSNKHLGKSDGMAGQVDIDLLTEENKKLKTVIEKNKMSSVDFIGREMDFFVSQDQSQELKKLKSDVNKLYSENADLWTRIQERDDKIIQFNNSNNSGTSRLERQLDMQRKLQLDVESRNKVLSQMQDKANETVSLEQKIIMQQSEIEGLHERINILTEYQEKTISEHFNKVQLAEKNISKLENQLESCCTDLRHAQEELSEKNTIGLSILQKEEISLLKSSLHDEKSQRLLVDQCYNEALSSLEKQQIHENELNQQCTVLQHSILELQNCLTIKQRQLESIEQSQSSDDANKNLILDQLLASQNDFNKACKEIFAFQERYDTLFKRYNDRKLHHKEKLQKAREIFNKEKNSLRAHAYKHEQELHLKKISLSNEVELKEKAFGENRSLLKEKRTFMMRLAEEEERWRDKSRALAMLEVRCRFLDEENSQLQDRVVVITRHKADVEKTLREVQKERQNDILMSLSQGQHTLSTRNSANLWNGSFNASPNTSNGFVEFNGAS